MMKIDILIFRAVKDGRTLLKQDDRVYIFDILICKMLSADTSDALILTEQKICRITGASLTGKEIALFLDFYIGDAVILQFYHDVRQD